jgi:hypothetical protein
VRRGNQKEQNLFAPYDHSYGAEIHRPLNQLVLVGALLLFFHAFSAKLGSALLVPEYLRYVFSIMGVAGKYLPAAVILMVLVGQHLMHRDLGKRKNRISFFAIGGMIVEGAISILPLIAASWMTGKISELAQINGGPDHPTLRGILESVGAGVYEEFLFRMVFISIALLIFTDAMKQKENRVIAISIIVSGILFALCHLSGAQLAGDAGIRWGSLVFLGLAGMWWGVLFIWRGFGVAVCSHICWDLLVVFFNNQ